MSLIINLFGAPGAGKSTTRAGVFHRLKLLGFNVEEVPEVAKDLTWEGRTFALGCAPYVWAKQLRNMERVLNKVDIVITDSPPLLASYYAGKYGDYPESFHQTVVDMHNRMAPSMNFYIRRAKAYNPAGRNQTEGESNLIGQELFSFLLGRDVQFIEYPGTEATVSRILDRIIEEGHR